MNKLIADAFESACAGFSADRVIADPDLNRQFVTECRDRGVFADVVDLNLGILKLRKTGALSGRSRSKRTHFPDEDEYRFAAEIAVRYLERRKGCSLDRIICDPELVAEFDEVAARTAPGFTPLQYRWAALNLRKAKKLEPELVARVAPPVEVINRSVEQWNPEELPSSQGMYLFYAADQLLYVGETENLRSRLKKHLDHSDNKGLARWIWEFGTSDLHLEVQVLERDTETRVRKSLELELIRSRNPVFNVQR